MGLQSAGVVFADSIGFGQALGLLLIFSPLILVWIFGLVDLFFRRHDLRGIAKAGWLVVIVLLPVIGTLIYFCVRPAGLTAAERKADAEFADQYAASRTEQLGVITNLHNAGKLSEREYEEARGHIMGVAR